ncbi:hypothetical protein HYH02_009803 [Chlamydomonas schloesseri]|uniref:Large ribosomal subunit protein uL24 C-terminal domain-containing protein n=1 Tax=Chlamydomonas schloesseri TaxID=2026947 RepID=A0A835TN94_9CHLO|nr:hypothetical protein HYH02_009803 [Chlamydomonas schloesseri]|eukprot:KAG2442011.1 hypothetical protein HYH02_009803 [Chlamydomonas schloesseri]
MPQVIVEGRNLRKKKVKTGAGPEDFFVVTMEAPLHYSQVQLVDPQTGKPMRVIFAYTADGSKVRSRKVPNPSTADIIATPSEEDPDPRAGLVGPKDTSAALARQATYTPSAGFPFRVRNLERIWAQLQPDADPHGRDQEGPGGASTSGRGAEGGRSGVHVIDVELAADGGAVGTAGAGAATASPAASAPSGGGVRKYSTCREVMNGRTQMGPVGVLLERLQRGRREGAAILRLPPGAGFAASGLMCSSRSGMWVQ